MTVVGSAERVALAVGDADRFELGLGHRRIHDLGARRLGEFEVAGQEVGVEVGLDHELDRESGFGGIGDVLGDVALWIDDHRSSGRLVTDQVRGVRQTFQVVLVELHVSPASIRS